MNQIDNIIDNALAEDIHTGDITTLSVLEKPRRMRARLVAKEDMVLSGIDVARRVFARLDSDIVFTAHFQDGARLNQGDIIAVMEGDAATLLQGERVSLNLLQRMSGIATQTAAYVKELEGTGARVVDTRKTTPGLRVLEKYSVRVGGGTNHRTGLYDGVLIKENHIAAAGGIAEAVAAARAYIPHTLKIEVETENLDEVKQALQAGADIIMLDNMSLEQMTEAVQIINKRALVEASGGVNLKTIRSIAQTGVDIISVGALTHSVRATDISMLMEGV
ncbi:carboxylating nicotinate-nucleotide diphosphorylase [Geomonas sp. Red69]|uniref:Quinolinate phosphoribosyltransferase [decarboxylating] n=1 Tax=Geomonas diazotrophica TaxID=2843197 RepID=A0ABX8JPB5_9BACT|nr:MULTISPECIES: carboxylating nicotinate-nucleotide diphosphorylase [Geomonas]MBU5637230.1 carboxylating nicotinate-nucleotide diphosphorylase [Geomonas diazotrophica]QWV99524.1 carboxylating nicotinate-nucleotide diphosphorylase [Geomonas nitrogeniifigens]QXE88699.1 carboxylating nicotinate-nucleotide diphosphorylase [Geomonas nitrogeniifigens]